MKAIKLPVPYITFIKTLTRPLLLILFFMFSINQAIGQEITINKIAVENSASCNQFDITLEVIGNPPPRPQEVVLIIDRSGSMDDGPVPEPIDFAQDAAIDFIENFFNPANNPTGLNRLAIVTYAASATLDQGLTDSTGEASLIATVNAITTGGATNIAQAIQAADNELINNGTFDCATSRSIILLTDGVPTRDFGGDDCDSDDTSSDCIDDAITAGVNAQTTTVSGVVFDQSVFTIGLTGAISGTQQTTALNTLNAIQNAGAFSTENNADLSGIYSAILGQLVPAASQLSGQALVTDQIGSAFNFVPGSFNASKGTATNSGQEVSWFVDHVFNETITLQYSIVATSDSCGINPSGTGVINYENSDCQVASANFNNAQVCIPCPELNTTLTRQGCTNFIDYSGTINQNGCTSTSDNFEWQFSLNGTVVGTANQLSGTFEYTGSDPFTGNFSASLVYNGTYGAGCNLDPVSSDSTIIIDPILGATVESTTDLDCFGATTGAINITVTGGTPPYTYVWSNGENTEDISGIPSGSYNVEISDSIGCSFTFATAININGPAAGLSETATITDVLCNGDATGAIDITVSGGTAPYSYSWDSGQTTEDISGLTAGDYQVTVTDANNCILVQTYTVAQPTAGLSETATITDVLCNGDATGAIDITVSGGTAPYSYSWDSGQATEDISGLTAGDYQVTVTDANNCILVQTYTVAQPTAGLSETATITDVLCNGDATGAIDITVSGGTAPYSYSWDSGQATEDISGLTAGDYQVTVTDANNCTLVQTYTVAQPVAGLSETATITDVLCNGDATGAIDITVSGGTAPYSYSWDSGQVTEDISGLTAGDYQVTVTDANNCILVQTYTVAQPVAGLSETATITDVLCNGDATGAIDITVSGGTAPYSYSWDSGQVTEDISGLTAGDYQVTITDANNCILVQTYTVAQPSAGLSEIAAITDVLCNGDATGAIDITVSGGTAPYTYSWDSGQTTEDISGLTAGDYQVTVTDANNCILVQTYTVAQPTAGLSETATITDVLCNGDATGAIDITVSGGTAPYSYSWDSGQATEDISGLTAGDYQVTVTDANNCILVQTYTVAQPTAGLSETATITDVLCNGDATGAIDITVSGGTAPYSYSWDSGQATEDISGLTAGDYQVTITDANNCILVQTYTVAQPSAGLSETAAITDVLCNGDATGAIDITVSGGTAPYSYSWDSGQATEDISGLTAGDYQVTITDANNCILVQTYTVVQPVAPLSLSITSQTNITCSGTGNVIINASGGTAPYLYSLDGGSTTQSIGSFSDLSQGNYTVTVIDNNNCIEQIDVFIENACIALVKIADVTLDPNDNCLDIDVNGTIDYILTVSNEGNVSLDNVTIDDSIINNASIVLVSGDNNSDNILQVDETWIYNASYSVTQDDIDAAQVTNTASVTADDPADNRVNDTSGATVGDNNPTVTPICTDAVIRLVKVADVTLDPNDNCLDIDVNGTIDYIFTVSNEGTVSLDNVVLNDPLVANATLDASTDINGDGILSVGESWTYNGSYNVTQDDIDAAQVTNTASVTADDPADNQVNDTSGATVGDNNPTVTPICTDAAIALIKVADVTLDPNDNCLDIDVNGTINYIFTVSNEGNVSLDNIVLDDPLVSNATLDASTDINGDGILSVGESWTYNGSYNVTQDDIDAGQVTNTASVTADDPADNQVNDTSGATVGDNNPTVTPICTNAAIALVKVADVTLDPNDNCLDIDVNGTIDYILTVSNEGNVSLDNLTIDDSIINNASIVLVSGDSNSDNILQVDETWIYNASYNVTQDDIDAGQVTNTASVTADDPADNQVNDTSGATVGDNNPTVTPICTNAAIALIKVADVTLDPNDNCLDIDVNGTINYIFTVSNEGNVSLDNVVLNDPLVSNATLDASTDINGDGILSVGESWTYNGSYNVTQDDIDAGQVTNTASVTADDPADNQVNDTSGATVGDNNPTVTPICTNAAIALIKVADVTLDPNDNCLDIDVNGTIDYILTVSNEGNVSLDNVTIDDSIINNASIVLVSGDSNSDNILQVDETWIYNASYSVTQDDIDAAQVINTASVTADDPADNQVNDTSGATVGDNNPTVTPICTDAVIRLVKVADVTLDPNDNCLDIDVNGTIDYIFTVSNEGNVSLDNVVLNDPLVSNATLDASTDINGDGILSVGESWTYNGSYNVTQDDIDAAQVTNTASVTADDPADNQVNDTSGATVGDNNPTVTPICTDAVIRLVKVADVTLDPNDNCLDIDVNGTIDYIFTVSNEGTVSLDNVVLNDPLVSNAALDASTDINGDGILSVGESWTYNGSYNVTQDDIDAGQVTNTASVTADDPADNQVNDTSGATVGDNNPTVTPICTDAIIRLVKVADVTLDPNDNCLDIDVNGTINYIFTVSNEGTVSLDNVVLDDPLVSNAALDASTDINGDGILSVGESWTYNGSYNVTQDDIDAAQVTNTASVTADDPADNQVNDTSGATVGDNNPTVTPICTDAAIALVKVADVTLDPNDNCLDIDVNGTIDYIFTVSNEGNVSLDNVVLNDPLVSNATLDASTDINGDGILSVGESWTYNGSYNVTQDDIDAAQVTNTASVTADDPADNQVNDTSGATVGDNNPTVTPICTDAVIRLVKVADVTLDPNDNCLDIDVNGTIDYIFTVSNEGNVSLDNVVLNDPLVANATLDASTDINGDGILSVGESWTYNGSYNVTQDDIDAAQVTNTASVTADDPADNQVNDTSGATVGDNNPTVTPICTDAVIRLVKVADVTLDPNDNCLDIDVNGTIDYIFTVSNEGNVSLDNVVLNDPLVSNATLDASTDINGDGILSVGESWTYNGSYNVTQDDIDAAQVTNTASVTADDPADNQVNDTSGATVGDNNPTVTPICTDAIIRLVKVADVTLDPNDNCLDIDVNGTIDYIFTVSNEGTVSLDNVVLNDPLVANATLDASTDINGDGILSVGESWTYNGSYNVTQDDIDAGQVTNTASVTADDPADNQVNDTSGATVGDNNPTVTPICTDAVIRLVKVADVTLDPNDNCLDIDVNGTIDYIFTVSNEGTVSLDNVVLDDPLVANATLDVSTDINGDGILSVGESWTYNGSYNVTQDDIDAGQVTNTASVTADDPADNQVNDTSGATVGDNNPTVTPICTDAAIALVKVADVTLDPNDNCLDIDVNGTIDYIFTVSNEGNVSLDNVVLDDPLVSNATLDASTDINGDGILSVGESWTYNGSYNVTQDDIDAAQVINTASVTADDPADNQVNDTSGATVGDNNPTVTPICTDAAIALVKVADVTLDPNDNCLDIDVNGTIDYIFTVSNEGTVSLDNVVLNDPLVANATLDASTDINGDGILSVGESWTYNASYNVTQDDIDTAQVINTASVTADDPADNQVNDTSGATVGDNNPTVTPICTDAAIALVKVADVTLDPNDSCLDIDVNGTIDYIFTVSNEGNVSLDNVVLNDPLVSNATLDASTDINGDGILSVGESWTYNGSYNVTQDDIDAAQVINTASVTADDPADNQVNDTSGATVGDNNPTVTPICTDAAIALVKVADVTLDPNDSCLDIDVNGTIDYIFTVSNEGTVSLDNVVLNDPLVANATLDVSTDINGDGILSVGESWTYNGSYNVTQDDIDAAQVTNTASVTADDPADNQVNDTSGATVGDNNPTVTPICTDAIIRLVKVADVTLDPNDNCLDIDVNGTIDYIFTVSNEGTVSLDNVVLNDPLVANTTLDASTDINGDGILSVGESWTYNGSYNVTQDDIDAAQVTNTASVTADDPADNQVNDTSGATVGDNNPTVTPICTDAAIALVKVADVTLDPNDSCLDIDVNGTIDYIFTVSNEGNVSLDNVVLDDPLVSNATLDASTDINGDGILSVGESWTYNGSYNVTQDDIDTAQVINTASVTADDPADNQVNDTSGATVGDNNPTVTPICTDAAIALVKVADVTLDPNDSCLDIDVNGTIDYIFTVSNEGNVSLDNVVLDDPLVSNATLDASTDINGDGILSVGESWTYNGSYNVTQDDIDTAQVINTASVTADDPADNQVNDTSGATVGDNNPTVTPICTDAVIRLVKVADVTLDPNDNCLDIDVNGTIDYIFTVSNEGTVSLDNVVLNDPLVANATLDVSTDINGDGILSVGESWTYNGSYNVTQDDIDAGQVTNTASVTADDPADNQVNDTSGATVGDNNPTVTPLCFNPGISIVKTGLFNNESINECAELGETISYTITVTNTGNVSLDNIGVIDSLLDNANPSVPLQFITSGDADNDNELDPTETWIYTADYPITADDIIALEVDNTATVNAQSVVNGDSVSDMVTITTELVKDTTPPDSSSCAPLDETIECNGVNNETLADNWNTANIQALQDCATDNCDDNFSVTSDYAFSNLVTTCGAAGTINVTYTLTDIQNNSSTFTATFTIEDNTAPVIDTLPAESTIDCPDTPSFATATATDACGSDFTLTFEDVTTNGSCAGNYSVTRTWTATDECGNVSTASQTINVQDITAPTLTVPSDITIECTEDESSANTGMATGTDTCGTVTITESDVETAACGNTKTIVRTWTVTDECGNTVSADQMITVVDTTPPAIDNTNKDDIVIQCGVTPDGTLEAWLANNAGATATDTCGTVTWSNDYGSNTNVDCANGAITVTFTATDDCGNASSTTATYSIIDTVDPVLTIPADITIECTEDTTPANTGTATATDDCAAPNVSFIDTEAPNCGNTKTITRTWTAVDACGNTVSANQTITVVDTTAPTFTVPADITIECDVDPTDLSITGDVTDEADNCSSGLEAVYSDNVADGSCANASIITRTWTLTDDCNNTTTLVQTITVEDTTAPTFTVPADITIECDVDPTDLSITGDVTDEADNCSSGLEAVYSDNVADGSCANASIITRTWTLTDDCDNTTTLVQTITVEDTTAPTFTVPADITIECDVDPTDLSITGDATDEADNCSSGLEAVYSDNVADGSCANASIITRTWTLTDDCDNTTTLVQTITVEDTTAPTFTVPADITIECDVDPTDLSITGDVTDEADNCSSGLEAVYSDNVADGSCANASIITRTWTLTDDCDNTTTLVQTITVEDATAPTFTVPADITIECDVDPTDLSITGDVTDEADNCSSGLEAVYSDNVADGSCANASIITRTWTLTDDCDNTTTLVQTINVEDTTAPTFTVPADITIECDVDPTDLSITGDVTDEADNCSTGLEAVYSDNIADGSCANASIITRTWTLTDDCDNITTLVQTINVEDTTAPTFTGPADITIECDVDSTDLSITGDVTDEADNCATGLDATYSDVTSDSVCIGDYIIERTWKLIDNCGNETEYIQIITVQDTTAPTLVTPIEDITIVCDDVPDVPNLIFEDACSNNIAVVFNEDSNQVNDFEDYEIIRTWTVTDDCGNEAVFTQNVFVEFQNVISTSDTNLCVLDEELDLFDLLSGDFEDNGTWTAVSGDATLDDSFFDPSTVEVGVYTFRYAITEGSCPTEVEVNVTVDDDCVVLACGQDNVVISKTVTANGDTINDVFEVTGIEDCGFVIELQIFNRWGAEIYKNNNYQNDWNGDAHGSSAGVSGKVPTGTYYYIINLRNSGLAPFTGPIYVATDK